MTIKKLQDEKRRFIIGYLLALALGYLFRDMWLISSAILIYFIYEAHKSMKIEGGIRYLYYLLALIPFLDIIPFFGVLLRFGNMESRITNENNSSDI